jgi:hypothetical protein
MLIDSCPDWLRLLVQKWQQDAATVITFNYDQLVELAWLLHAAPSDPDRPSTSTDLYDTTRYAPALGANGIGLR